MRLFVSVPTMGRSDEDVEAVKQAALKRVRETLDPSATLTDSYCHADAPAELYGDRIGIWYLGESLKRLAESETAFFADGWEAARGCRIEHAVCREYNIPILYADTLDRLRDAKARKQWTRHESGVDPRPGGDAP